MSDRRSKKRESNDRRHPLGRGARLRATGETTPRGRITVQLNAETIERLRNAVYWTPGATLAGIVESCVIEAVDRMEQQRGDRFPQRERSLAPGRPRK